MSNRHLKTCSTVLIIRIVEAGDVIFTFTGLEKCQVIPSIGLQVAKQKLLNVDCKVRNSQLLLDNVRQHSVILNVCPFHKPVIPFL